MKIQTKINNFSQVKALCRNAEGFKGVSVRDCKGSIANAASILGMMSLCFEAPVTIEGENMQAVCACAKAVNIAS